MDTQSQQRGTAALRYLTPEDEQAVADLAARHDVSREAVGVLLAAMVAGGGSQAQFNHPDLGGMGQWSRGGMLMVGDMFNHGLKAKVAALAQDLAALVDGANLLVPADATSASAWESGRWPAELGRPGSTGSQNDMHYAVFPDTHRFATRVGSRTTVYDTADHHISGLGQQQGGDQSVTLTSQHGPIRLESLRIVSRGGGRDPAGGGVSDGDEDGELAPPREAEPVDKPSSSAPTASAIPPDDHGVIFAKIEGLAKLREKGILSAEEYAAKKADLLGRL
ncbi:SHOCT domain-containing protein [Sphingobium sp.]|uniref:SHOCT domain-containing protein n=1 Tax=Sphingobium sp. TaxID=1912891 RepID=UPI002C0DB496|nr:SHOCT domain-containing protein [Sphingobium sp.]HUD90120.1 SHOCT domain-containing protein [Sphingobium sp.]